MSGAPPVAARTLGGFLWTLVRTDLKVRYHGTLGGFLWALLKPAAMFLVLLSVFSFIFASRPGYRLNLLVGLFLWDFFAEATKSGLLSLAAKGFLITKARFPAWLIVAAAPANALVSLAVFASTVMMVLAISGHAPQPGHLALFAWYLFHYVAMVFGFSLATSVLFLRYRDLNQVWEVVIQAGFFLAPIIYPLEILPERFHFYLYLWPPTPVIQFARSVLVEGVVPSLRAHLYLTGQTLAILAAGILTFRRLSPRAAEYL